jgi:hypothetical protein
VYAIFFQAELSLLSSPELWTRDFLTTFISGISTWVETVSFQAQPANEIKDLLLELMPFLDRVQPFLGPQDQFYVMRVVHGLLRTRCILLLQEVYQWVVNKAKIESKVEAVDGEERDSQECTSDRDTRLLALAYISDIGS